MRIPTGRSTLVLLMLICAETLPQVVHWEPSRGPYTGNYRTLAVLSPERVIAGGEDGTLLLSIDTGSTWTEWGSAAAPIADLQLHPGGMYLVATHGAGLLGRTDTSDWSSLSTGLPVPDVSALAILRDGSILAGCWWEPGWVYRSTDLGTSWSRADSGLAGHGVTCLGVAGGDTVYAGTNFSGVYRTTNGGLIWAPVNNGIADSGNTAFVLDVLPDHTVVAGFTTGIYFTSNGGQSWTTTSDPRLSGEINDIAHDASAHLFVATGSGLYHSTNHGVTWLMCPGLTGSPRAVALPGADAVLASVDGIFRAPTPASQFVQCGGKPAALTVLAAHKSSGLVCSNGTSIFHSTDGATWHILPSLGEYRGLTSISILPAGGVYAGYNYSAFLSGGVMRLEGPGTSWVDTPFPVSQAVVALHSDSAGVLYAGTPFGLYRSAGGGALWTGPSLEGKYLQCFASRSPAEIWAGTYTGAFSSTDSGTTWNDQSAGLPGPQVKAFGLLSSGEIAGTFSSGVAFRTDSMSQWLPAEQLQNAYVTSVCVVEDIAYAGVLSGGVHRSRNGGRNWEFIGPGLVSVRSLAVGPGGYLYAATDELGLVRTSDLVVGVKQEEPVVPQVVALEQNFPNPFNSTTVLRFQVAGSGIVRLVVYDLLGREVEALVNGHHPSGRYEVRWDAGHRPSGVYVCRLDAGGTTLSRLMILLR